MIAFASHISYPRMAALHWSQLRKNKCSIKQKWGCLTLKEIRWGKRHLWTTLLPFIFSCLSVISTSLNLSSILTGSKSHSFISTHMASLCVVVTRFLSLGIHGNGSMNGLFRRAQLHPLPPKPQITKLHFVRISYRKYFRRKYRDDSQIYLFF